MNRLKPKNHYDKDVNIGKGEDQVILYSIKDVQKILGRSEKFVYELFRQPDFPCFTVGRCKYIEHRKFQEWIDNLEMIEKTKKSFV